MAANKGTKHHAAKLTPAIVRAARKTREEGQFVVIEGKRHPVTISSLARKYGVSHQTMHSALTGKTWGHIS